MKLVVINASSIALQGISFVLVKNSFGLAAKGASCTEVPKNSKKNMEVICAISADNMNQQEPPSCPFKVKARLNSKADSFLFELPCPLHVFLMEGGQATKENFKNYWLAFDKSKEFVLEVTNLKPSCQSPDGMIQALEHFNVGLTTRVKKQENGQTMLYCSCQTVNSLPIVVEIGMPGGKPGIAARVVVRVPVPPIGPLMVESLKFILVETKYT